MNHIVIIGFMGSGKTRVGKRLAKDFNLPFVDVDRVVSKKMNLTMKEIFDRFGEPFYRALETTVIKALIDDPEQKIISLGSGLPMQEQNEKYIKKLGTVVYLKGSSATLKKRLENSSSNPLIEGEDREDIKEAINDIYSEVVEELDNRLGLQLYKYKVEVKYDSEGIPESFKHTFWLNFGDDTLKNMFFIPAMQQLIHVLSTGDDEVKVTLLNMGIKIELIA